VASLHSALLQHKVQLGELAGVAALKDGHLPQESQLLSCCCQLQVGSSQDCYIRHWSTDRRIAHMSCELLAAKQLSALAGSCLHGQHSKLDWWPPDLILGDVHTMHEDNVHHNAAECRGEASGNMQSTEDKLAGTSSHKQAVASRKPWDT